MAFAADAALPLGALNCGGTWRSAVRRHEGDLIEAVTTAQAGGAAMCADVDAVERGDTSGARAYGHDLRVASGARSL
jgi:hypothetical protein